MITALLVPVTRTRSPFGLVAGAVRLGASALRRLVLGVGSTAWSSALVRPCVLGGARGAAGRPPSMADCVLAPATRERQDLLSMVRVAAGSSGTPHLRRFPTTSWLWVRLLGAGCAGRSQPGVPFCWPGLAGVAPRPPGGAPSGASFWVPSRAWVASSVRVRRRFLGGVGRLTSRRWSRWCGEPPVARLAVYAGVCVDVRRVAASGVP